MEEKRSRNDELARRRSLHSRQQAAAPDEEPSGADGDDLPKMGWREILALTVTAYQVLLPLLLALVGALLIAYFLFAWYFH